jgi:hypothetical protein
MNAKTRHVIAVLRGEPSSAELTADPQTEPTPVNLFDAGARGSAVTPQKTEAEVLAEHDRQLLDAIGRWR